MGPTTNFQLNKINDLSNYIKKYEKQIDEEKFKSEFDILSDSLYVLASCITNIDTSINYSNALSICHADKIIRFIHAIKIPEKDSTANRIFKNVVMEELQKYFGPSKIIEFPNDIFALDNKKQALRYEALAAESLDRDFIEHNLLCSLNFLRNNHDENEINRIENLLDALKKPTEISFAFRYLFSAFKVNNISFSIHHPRFIEVLNDLKTAVNSDPREEIMMENIKKWVAILKLA